MSSHFSMSFSFLFGNRNFRKLLVANSLYMIPQLELAEPWKKRRCFLMTLRNLTTYWEKSETNGILFVASLWRGEHECPLHGSVYYAKTKRLLPESISGNKANVSVISFVVSQYLQLVQWELWNNLNKILKFSHFKLDSIVLGRERPIKSSQP